MPSGSPETSRVTAPQKHGPLCKSVKEPSLEITPCAVPMPRHDSQCQRDAGRDQQQIDDLSELRVAEPAVPSEPAPGSEQRRRHIEQGAQSLRESERAGSRRSPADCSQCDDLHDQDERLIDAALTVLRFALERAPNGDKGARKPGKPA